jgi:hypothetical protein
MTNCGQVLPALQHAVIRAISSCETSVKQMRRKKEAPRDESSLATYGSWVGAG